MGRSTSRRVSARTRWTNCWANSPSIRHPPSAISRSSSLVRYAPHMPLPPFQTALNEHRDALARFLAATVGPADAEDCLQETLIAALRAYPRLREGSNVRAWLFTIARNKALDEHRARARRPVPVADTGAGSVAVADGPDEE